MPLSVCRSLYVLMIDFEVLVLILAKTFRKSTEMREFLFTCFFTDVRTHLGQYRFAGSLVPGSIIR